MVGPRERKLPATDPVPPCVLVIFGASGDLTERKLLPAIERLATFGRLPKQLALVGVARTPMTDDEFRAHCASAAARSEPASPEWLDVLAGARYVSGNYDDLSTYERLRDVLAECDASRGTAGNRVYYFATPRSCSGRSQ